MYSGINLKNLINKQPLEKYMQNFYQKTIDAKKILIIEFGFLGDTVHLIPALWAIKSSYPNAEVHVAVSDHIINLIDAFDWIDKSWGYPRYPKRASLFDSLSFIRKIRKQNYDVLINLNGSERSCVLGVFFGIKSRLGRLLTEKVCYKSRLFFTDFTYHPFHKEPIYKQRCYCLKQAGLPKVNPSFNFSLKPEFLKGTNITLEEVKNYIHLSPFTTSNIKQLSLETMANLINQFKLKWPNINIVLSCAPFEREIVQMNHLLNQLNFKPWKVFKGDLNLIQLTGIIGYSKLHLSGDTGTLHLALMTATPSISWFQPTQSKNWISDTSQVIFGKTTSIGPQKTVEVEVSEILDRVQVLLENRCF